MKTTNMATEPALTRYAVYAVDPTTHDEHGRGMPGRLDWVGEAADEDAAIRAALEEIGGATDPSEHVAVEVVDPAIAAGAVSPADNEMFEVVLDMTVGPESYRGTAILARRASDGVWDAWGDDVSMWLDDELVRAADAADELDGGTRDIVLSEIVATARRAIRRAEVAA